jgi:hypothetical protein
VDEILEEGGLVGSSIGSRYYDLLANREDIFFWQLTFFIPVSFDVPVSIYVFGVVVFVTGDFDLLETPLR